MSMTKFEKKQAELERYLRKLNNIKELSVRTDIGNGCGSIAINNNIDEEDKWKEAYIAFDVFNLSGCCLYREICNFDIDLADIRFDKTCWDMAVGVIDAGLKDAGCRMCIITTTQESYFKGLSMALESNDWQKVRTDRYPVTRNKVTLWVKNLTGLKRRK